MVPIASAGIHLLGQGSGVAPDSFVLALPLAGQRDTRRCWPTWAAWRTATIVASVALATCSATTCGAAAAAPRLGQPPTATWLLVLWIRHGHRLHRRAGLATTAPAAATSLASFGLMAFVAVAQFAPAPDRRPGWQRRQPPRRRSRAADRVCGLGHTPAAHLTDAGWLDPAWMRDGPFEIHWLRPPAVRAVGLGPADPARSGRAGQRRRCCWCRRAGDRAWTSGCGPRLPRPYAERSRWRPASGRRRWRSDTFTPGPADRRQRPRSSLR